MPSVRFVSHRGDESVVDIPEGWSLMEGAVKNGISGILADCGGACTCATCHVYVGDEWLAALPERDETETDMLEFAIDVRESSRLSCQIRMTGALEGLVVNLPASQV